MCIAYIKVIGPLFYVSNGVVMSKNGSMMFELHNVVVSKDTVARIASLGQVLFNSKIFFGSPEPQQA